MTQYFFVALTLLIVDKSFSNEIKSNRVDFKPHMVNHLHEGCPIGSECTKLYGQKREKFNHSLKTINSRKKYFKNHGAPFRYLIRSNEIENKDHLAIWDSRCFHHRKSKIPFLEIEVFTKSSKQKSLPVISKKILYKKNKSSEVQIYELPINADITGVRKNNIYFDIRENLSSYIYKVNKKGKFSVEKNALNQKFKRTSCPQDLLKAYSKQSYPTFKSYFCSITPDGDTLLTPVTCI